MNSFQDPILTDSTEYPADSIGMYTYATRSFQDPLSRPLHMNKTPNNEESLVISDHESVRTDSTTRKQSTEAPQEDVAAGFSDSFQDPPYKWDTSQW